MIHTGQHYDGNMSGIFFSELEIPLPRHSLGIGSGSHAEQTGRMLIGLALDTAKVLLNAGKNLESAFFLYKMRYKSGIKIDIQPHSFGLDEFKNDTDNFFIAEIAKTGIDITDKVLAGMCQ